MKKLGLVLLLLSFLILPVQLKFPPYAFDLFFVFGALILLYTYLKSGSQNVEVKLSLALFGVVYLVFSTSFEHYHSAQVFQAINGVTFAWLIVQQEWHRSEQKIVTIWVLLMTFFSIVLYLRLTPLLPMMDFGGSMFTGVFFQENAQMLFTGLGLYFMGYQLQVEKTRKWKIIIFASIALLVLVFLLSMGARIVSIAFLGGGVFVLLHQVLPLKFLNSKKTSYVATLIVAVFLVVTTLYVKKSSDLSLIVRWDLWEASVLLALENPLGIGLGEFSFKWSEYLANFNKISPSGFFTTPESSHNFFLSALVELGWVGFILSIGIVFIPFIKLLRRMQSEKDVFLSWWCGAYSFLIVVISLTTVAWSQPGIRFVTWAFLGLSWNYFGLNMKLRLLKKYKIIYVLALILSLIFGTYFYSKFLYSEYILHKYGQNKELNMERVMEVLRVYPLSGPAQKMLVDMFIGIDDYSEAKKRIRFSKSISGSLFNPELQEIEIAKLEKDMKYEKKLLKSYLKKYPKESFQQGIRYLSLISQGVNCEEFSLVKKELKVNFPLPKVGMDPFLYHRSWYVLNPKIDSLIYFQVYENNVQSRAVRLNNIKLLDEMNCLED